MTSTLIATIPHRAEILCSELSMLDVREFVRTYTSEAESSVSFAWNGKHATEFVDANMLFRKEVCDYFEGGNEVFPLPLIAALYKAETLFAKEAWGVNAVVSRLAQELLERGGVEYLGIYLEGARCGMDAFMATGNIALSKQRCQELVHQCQANATAKDGNEKQWALLADRFSFLLSTPKHHD